MGGRGGDPLVKGVGTKRLGKGRVNSIFSRLFEISLEVQLETLNLRIHYLRIVEKYRVSYKS